MASIYRSISKSAKGLWKSVPLILGTVLLVSLITALIPRSFYSSVFSRNMFLDSILGSLVGSISAGNPIVSYIIGGELLSQGIGLVAVTAFIVAWVTVGIVQFPAESVSLGRRFSILRNLTAFGLAILTAFITVGVFQLL